MPTHGVGTVVDGKYRILRAIGEGGMGFVYVAEHVFLKKNLALKMLRPEAAQQAGLAARFEQEARATSLLEHENIVRVTDFGRTRDDELYLVMELLDGRSLADELTERRRLDVGRALWIAASVARGLEAAQASGIVHRDLKPENVFLASRPDGKELVKLVDFGIAKLAEPGGVRLTTTGAVMGTPLYMAPEQVTGAPDLDGRVDLHALGVMLYEMIAGRTPYEGATFGEIAHAILNGRPRPLDELVPEVGAALNAVVMKAFAGNRYDRFQTATELREALEGLLGVPISAPPPPPSGKLPQRPPPPSGNLPQRPPPPSGKLPQRPPPPAPSPSPPSPPSPPPLPSLVPLGGPWTEPDSLRDTPAQPLPAVEAHPTAAYGVPRSRVAGEEPPRPAPPSAAFRAPAPPPALELDGQAPLSLDRAPEDAPPIEIDRPPSTVSPPRAHRGLVLAAVAIIAVAGGVWLFAAQHPPPPARVHVQIIDLPPGARVFLDGAPTPPSFELAGDTIKHRLRIEARGHATRLLLFDATSDQTIDGHLDRSE